MRFDLRRIEFRHSDWFSDDIAYEGAGRAQFDHPRGVLEGHTTVRVSQAGDVRAEMGIPAVIECERDLRFGLQEFLSGQEPEAVRDRWQLGLSLEGNPCSRLQVQTANGVFATAGEVNYSPTLVFPRSAVGRGGDAGTSVAFTMLRPQFDTVGAGIARYWVLPLTNFVSRFQQRVAELAKHRLRLWLTPDIPHEVAEDERAEVEAWIQLRDTLVAFGFADELGFIEPLPDYVDREERLRSGRDARLITAVMVGSTGQSSVDPDQLERWFPFDFLPVLGVATGSGVGAPWLELRDADGRLVRRLHYMFSASRYSAGHRSIDEASDRGTGRLLTRAQAEKHFGKAELRVAMSHLVRGNDFDRSIEDRLDHICRGIDGLADYLHLTHRNLLNTLTEAQQETIKTALQDASARIRAVADQARACGEGPAATVIEGIANRAAENPYIDANFGWAVSRLVDHWGLADNQVMARLYDSGDGDGLRRWTVYLSKLRGDALHGRFFDIVGGKHNVDELWHTTQHLIDILTRVLLKMLGYDGTYQPHVHPYTAPRSTDWVTPELSPSDLGY